MTEQAQDAETIFLAALDRATPQERAEYVQVACAGNAQLLRRVIELLDCHDATKGPLDAPPAGITDTIDGPSKNECAGTVIGPYKLLQQIGEGGFGVVFMAEQTQPVQRKVALKVIKAGMDSNQVIARFEAERQALAVMDHVNIARVFDGGTTEAGRPYFVMELVHGVPITKYCDDNRLTPRERLELFVPVCQAIQHAHQKGIIHRDIKPSNVMVTLYDGKPVPKVIDFGVAKATEQKLTERTLFTQYGAMVGTFEYMSPEQAEMSALGVDTRSDIFSLGVLLYELLTGSTPLERKRIREAAFGEIVRMIKEEEPPKPSTRLSDSGEALASISAQRHMEPTKLAKLVRGELDWIVMKSLEKDRNRRYESANSFAADLQRYLNDETVQACPPSAWYRFRKFARRNKGALAASLAVVMVVLLSFIGLAANYWMVKREKAQKEQALDNALREKERADANLVRARKAVKDYLTEVAGNPLLREADFHDLRRKLLESAIPFYQEFLKQQTDDPDLEAERGRAYGDLAMVREDLGQLDQALADYEQQRVIFARLAPDVQSKAVFRHGLAISYRNLANVYHAMSQPAKAQEAQRKAISIMEALTDEYPNAAPYRQELAGVLNNLGISLRGAARLEEAKKLHLRALELCERLKAESPDLPAYRKDLARCHHSLGTLYGVMHQYPKALTSLQQAADLLEGLAKEFPGEPEYRQHWAGSLTNKSFFLFDTGRVPECLKAQEDALQIEEKLADDFSSVPGYRRSAEQSRINLSEMLRAMRRNQDALAALDKAIAALDRLAQQWPKVPENLQSLALAHNNRSLVLRQLNRNEEALESCRKAQALQEDLTNRYPDVLRYAQDLGMTYNNTGDFLNELGRSVEAITVLEKAIALREKQARKHKDVPAYAVDLAAAYLNMGASQMAQRRFEVALDWFKKTLAEIEPVLAREGRLTEARSVACNAHANRGMALDNLSRYPEAVAEFDKSLTFDDGQKRIPIRLQRASTLVRSGDYARAAAEADALAGDADANSGNIYDAACVYALSAAVKRNDAQRTEQYAVRAVGLLRRAVEKGYKDAAHMKKDPDLEALRGREDFKRLLSDLEKPKE